MRRLALVAAAWALLASTAAADDERGLQLVREAQAAMAKGDDEHAVELLKQARVELPGSPLVANTMGDALRDLGRYPEAITEYQRGQNGDLQRHAEFNRAVTRHLMAEQALQQASVPADVGALPDGPQPEMLQAIEQANGQLRQATNEFLDTLQREPDGSARESLEALGRRSDALAAMAEELRKRQQQDQKNQDQKKQDEQKQDQQQDQKSQDQKNQDQQQQDQQQQDQQQQDQQQQAQQQDQQQDQQKQDQAQQDQQQQQADQQEQQPAEPSGPPRELSPEEVQQLLDRLDKLEQQARELQKAREAVRRKPVEKDW